MHLFGSHVVGTRDEDSDIDLAVSFGQEKVDRFDEGVRLTRPRRGIDLRIEAHAFARKDLQDKAPVVREIVRTGQWIA